MIEPILVEMPNPAHLYGAKGVGEVNIAPPMAAIANRNRQRSPPASHRIADVALQNPPRPSTRAKPTIRRAPSPSSPRTGKLRVAAWLNAKGSSLRAQRSNLVERSPAGSRLPRPPRNARLAGGRPGVLAMTISKLGGIET